MKMRNKKKKKSVWTVWRKRAEIFIKEKKENSKLVCAQMMCYSIPLAKQLEQQEHNHSHNKHTFSVISVFSLYNSVPRSHTIILVKPSYQLRHSAQLYMSESTAHIIYMHKSSTIKSFCYNFGFGFPFFSLFIYPNQFILLFLLRRMPKKTFSH